LSAGLLEHRCTDACQKDHPDIMRFITCPMCENTSDTCEHCDGWGHFHLPYCPYRFVTDDIWELIEAADLFTRWPGQTDWRREPMALVDGVMAVWHELDKLKLQLMKPRESK
jgi:hypothetical protein